MVMSSFQFSAACEAAVMLIDAGRPDRAAWLLRKVLQEGDGRRTITGVKYLMFQAGVVVEPERDSGIFRLREGVADFPPLI